MSRHRDVRCMNYSDEYDGYDDIYGHSVEDDYCVSPSAEQFMFDRNKKQNIASFFTEPDIKEDNEEDHEVAGGSSTKPELSEMDSIKLVSCIETIRNIVGDSLSESLLTEKVIDANFDVEVALDNVLKLPMSEKNSSVALLGKDTLSQQTAAVPVMSQTVIKVVPAATTTVVKGFNLNSADNHEFLTPQMGTPRSQSPGSQLPDSKRRDDENNKKIGIFTSTTPVCQSPISSGRVTPEMDNRGKIIEDKRDPVAIYKKNRGDAKEKLHLVVVGHVDAGKSTLLGRLLCDLGQISSRLMHKYQQESKKVGKQSFAYAWVLDETGEERERGITMDIGYSTFETETKSITLLDAPGHKDFIPNMITGATQADVALLVVDATRGEFETGFDSGGQTREHALLLRSLGVSQLAVVINKLDTVHWSEERFNEIVNKMSIFLKQAGYRDNVTFVPCSGLSGENIVSPPKAQGLSSWYTGPTLLSIIDKFKCPERPVHKPLRFSVNDIFKGTGSGFCVSGHIETGMVAAGDKVLILPANEAALVKGLQVDESTVTNAFAGDHISLTLSGVDQQKLAVGDIISSPGKPVPVTCCFQAHIVVFAIAIPITKGLPVVLHVQSLVQPAVITKLIAQLHKNGVEVTKKKPRCLQKNSNAIVEITTNQPICLELYRDVKQLGRIMIRVSGTTIAAGLVTKIK